MLRILKAMLLMELVVAGKEISKENLVSPDILGYKAKRLEAIRAKMRNNPTVLIDDEEEDEPYTRYPAKKKQKEPKKSTYEETFELWQQDLSPDAIAQERKLTVTTIFSHFAKLIEMGRVAITDILPKERVAELADAFEGYAGEALGELKEKHGDAFTWGELRLYRATLEQDRV